MSLKDTIRKILFDFNIPATTNLRNDILLKKILKQSLSKNDNAIDIGAHKGEILELFLKYAPQGKHFAIEPIPFFYNKLKNKFPEVTVFPYAVGNKTETTEFYWIKDKPAYSGLNKRKFSEQNSEIQPLMIDVKKLDDIIPKEIKIKFIKIDVEGAELQALEGSKNIIQKDKPLIAFEFGLGGSDFYSTTATDMFNFFTMLQYQLFDFESFLNQSPPYSQSLFKKTYQDNIIYNFLAIPVL